MYTPCDDGYCPYNAERSETCRVCCGLGVDEDPYPYEEEGWEDPGYEENYENQVWEGDA